MHTLLDAGRREERSSFFRAMCLATQLMRHEEKITHGAEEEKKFYIPDPKDPLHYKTFNFRNPHSWVASSQQVSEKNGLSRNQGLFLEFFLHLKKYNHIVISYRLFPILFKVFC